MSARPPRCTLAPLRHLARPPAFLQPMSTASLPPSPGLLLIRFPHTKASHGSPRIPFHHSFSSSSISHAIRRAGRQISTVGPLQRIQSRIDRRLPKNWLFYGIIGANALVFAAWQYADSSLQRFRDFGPTAFMLKNFASSWANVLRPWTFITSCFSHRDASHIFVNLFSFYFMGQAAMSVLTTSRFLGLYLVAGIAGNAVQLLSDLVTSDLRGRPPFSVGASGAISGVLTFFAMAFPRQSLLLFAVVPVPAAV